MLKRLNLHKRVKALIRFGWMKQWGKRVAAMLFGEYELYYIFCSPDLDSCQSSGTDSAASAGFEISELHEPDECAKSESVELQSLPTQFGRESFVLGVWDHGRLVGGAVV